MAGTKWNRMKSIPVFGLSDSEREEAFPEWAEGCKPLELLLRKCYDLSLETAGCHVGEDWSYLGIIYTNKKEKLLSKLLYGASKVEGTYIYVAPDGGNPESGPRWHMPLITFIYQGIDSNMFFETLLTSLSNSGATKKNLPGEVFNLALDTCKLKRSMCDFYIKKHDPPFAPTYSYEISTYYSNDNDYCKRRNEFLREVASYTGVISSNMLLRPEKFKNFENLDELKDFKKKLLKYTEFPRPNSFDECITYCEKCLYILDHEGFEAAQEYIRKNPQCPK